MNQNIIAYSGAHGTGKTTAVYAMVDKLKRSGIANGNIGMILETARLCPMSVLSAECSKPSESAQVWIFAKQMQEEAEAGNRYDLVISDRSLVDCIAYTRYFGYYGLANAMERMVVETMFRYQQIVFRPIAENDYLVDDGFRSMDPRARARIEKIMLSLYDRLGVTLLTDRKIDITDMVA